MLIRPDDVLISRVKVFVDDVEIPAVTSVCTMTGEVVHYRLGVDGDYVVTPNREDCEKIITRAEKLRLEFDFSGL